MREVGVPGDPATASSEDGRPERCASTSSSASAEDVGDEATEEGKDAHGDLGERTLVGVPPGVYPGVLSGVIAGRMSERCLPAPMPGPLGRRLDLSSALLQLRVREKGEAERGTSPLTAPPPPGSRGLGLPLPPRSSVDVAGAVVGEDSPCAPCTAPWTSPFCSG